MLNQNFSLLKNHIRTANKGTTLFREGDTDTEMYFVLRGDVELSRVSGNTVLTESLVAQGGFFGEMSFIQNEQRNNTATTISESVLLVINNDNFNDVISINPQLAMHIITGLCLRIRDLESAVPTVTTSIPSSIVVPETSELKTSEPETDNKTKTTAIAEIFSNKTFELSSDSYNKYCFTKEVSCPVCEHKFTTDMLRESKLIITNRSDELRTFYEDIDPIFYNVWICPNCYYSMKRIEFDKITEIQKRNLANQSDQRKENWNLDFNNKLSFDFAVTTYKIAIECCDSLGKKNIEDRIAGLWLNTAWLYDDMEQPENALEARKNALTKYKNAYIFGTDRTDEQDQKIEYLIGKLSWVTGNIKEAREHFFKVVNRRNGHQLLKQMAEDALEQLKLMQKEA